MDTAEKPSAQQLEVLDELEGWAKRGDDADGGRDGHVYHVTTLDGGDGPGTLRAGLEAACPLWIVFDVNGTIKLKDTAFVESDKTVDGRGADVTIDTNSKLGDDMYTGFQLTGVDNVVIMNLTFDDDFAQWNEDNEGSDGINIEDSHHVWIHHNTFKRWADGAVDVKGVSTSITVSWNKFQKMYQAVLVDADDKTNSMYLTFHHNYCKDVQRRCPKASGGAWIHAYNNVIRDWQHRSILSSVKNGKMRAEYNVFLPGDEDRVGKVDKNSTTRLELDHSYGDITPDFHGSVADWWEAWARSISSVEKCHSDACFKSLRDDVKELAGPTL